MKNLRYFYLTGFFIGILTSFSQVPDFSKVPSLHDGDSLNITRLIKNGAKISDEKVICWFPKDSLSPKQMTEISDMLNAGIRSAEKFIGVPLLWQSHQLNEPYTFYFRSDRFISHASQYGFVSVPFWRIRDGKAPWLHEVIHEMLCSKNGSWYSNEITEKDWSEKMPVWLFEGLPDYISLKVSVFENLKWFDVFSNSYNPNIDSLFLKEIKSDKGSYILSFIGSKGVMPELFSNNRMHYAPAFYHGSHSFVNYLVTSYNIKILLKAVSLFEREQETIEKLTGKSLEELKKEWLIQLKTSK